MSNKITDLFMKKLETIPKIFEKFFISKTEQQIPLGSESDPQGHKEIHPLSDIMSKDRSNQDLLHRIKTHQISIREAVLQYTSKIKLDRRDNPYIDDLHHIGIFYKSGEFEHGISNIRLFMVGFGGCHPLSIHNALYNEIQDQIEISRNKNYWLPGADAGDTKVAFLNVHDSKYYDISLEFVTLKSQDIFYLYTIFRTYEDEARTRMSDEVKVRSGRILISSEHPLVAKISNLYKTLNFNSKAEIENYDQDASNYKIKGGTGQQGGFELASSIGTNEINEYKKKNDTFTKTYGKGAIFERVFNFTSPPLGGSAGFGKGFSNYFKDHFQLTRQSKYKGFLPAVGYEYPDIYVAIKGRASYRWGTGSSSEQRKWVFFWPQINAWVMGYGGYVYYTPNRTIRISSDLDFDPYLKIKDNINDYYDRISNRKIIKDICRLNKTLFNHNTGYQNRWAIGSGGGGVPHKALFDPKEPDKLNVTALGDSGNNLITWHEIH